MTIITDVQLFEIDNESVLRNIDRSWLIFASLIIFFLKMWPARNCFRSTTTWRRLFSDHALYGHILSSCELKNVLRGDNSYGVKGLGRMSSRTIFNKTIFKNRGSQPAISYQLF